MNELQKLMKDMKVHTGEAMSLSGGVVNKVPPAISSDEWCLVDSAGEKRQREFAWGREYAHQAMSKLPGSPVDTYIGKDEKGCPLWPGEIVGSISHTNHYGIAAVALKSGYGSIGIDLEEIERMHTDLWSRLFTEHEISNLREHTDKAAQQKHAAILFSAKESLYKCDYPMNHRQLDFTDVQVSVCSKSGKLKYKIVREDVWPGYEGYYAAGASHVLTMACCRENL